ncbi:hypothetical protein, partial [Streptococcus infantis]|uniref:hypothetical protein n=1 Tax=Streptococcus infantis TaxID=68892 RepID=UPI0005F321D1
MYFNRKNATQKNWRMIKKGKHFLFGCSLVFAVGATLVTPTVKADTVAGKGEVETTTTNSDSKASPDEEVGNYKAPATVATQPVAVEEAVVAEKPTVKVVNKEALTQLVEEVKGLDKTGKTEDSLSRLNTALEQAQKVLTNAEASQDQVDAAVASLKEAVAQLAAKEEKVATVVTEEKAEVAEEKTEASEEKAEETDQNTETSATQPKSRSRRAAGQERAQDRSMEGRDIKYVWQNRQATLNGGDPTQRAKIEYRQLDDYEVVNGKTVPTDPSGQGRPVLEWTVTFNEAQYDKPGGYWYFTIPKNVSDPYNFVTDYDGVYINRYGWKDANKESGAGIARAEGVQYIDDGNKLEMRVKNSTGSKDYNKVDGLSGVMGNSKKVYVLQTSIYSGVRKFTVRYRTVVEDPSQTISYLAGVESSGNLPRFNWNAISGKYDKHLVSQVATPSVTPNLTNTSVNVPVQTVASTSSTLSGTGTPGATIKLYIDGREQNIGNVTVDNDGNWTTGELPTALNNNQGDGTTIKPRQIVQVSQTVNGTESSRRTVPVSVGMTTVEPSSLSTNQDAVIAGQKEVTLKVPHDAGIAYLRYTNTAGQTVEIPVKRDNASAAWVSQKSDKATVKSYAHGKFEDTIVLTMADKIAGTEVSSISNVVEGGFSSVAGWEPRSVENQAPTIASAVEGNEKTVAQGAQLDLASLVTVADKEDDAQATLGDKVHAEVVSVNGNTATKTVDTNTQGTYTVKYKAVDSQGKESGEIEVTVVVNPARQNEAPTVEIPYSNKADKEVYVYGGEENSFDIKFKDDSGKIASATVKQGGNKDFGSVAGEADTINTQYGFKANVISSETPATADAPAVITYRGTPAATDGLTQDRLTAATKGENPDGLVLGWRYATATDTDGALIENKATGGSTATDPGAFRVVLKPQNQKYDIATPTEKVTVADPANVTEAELAKIKEKVQLEYSKNNDDANLADKKGTTADKTNKIQSVTKDADGNLVVTYADGSIDKKPLSEFVNVAPTVEIPYSNKDTKEVYVYGGEESSFDIKFKDDSGKIASATVKQGGNKDFGSVAGEADTINTQYGFKANVINAETPATADAPAVITYRGTPAATDGLTQDRLTAATKGENPAGLPLGWRYATATDTDGALIENTATGGTTATDPGAFRVVLKPQNQKYDIATPTEKVTVADPANVTEAELAKIKEKVQLEYSKNNDDANLADKKGTTADKTNKIQSVTKDDNGNLVVTYTDGSIDKKPLSEFVNVAPTVEIPYSNKDTKEVYVYGGEENSFDIKFKDDSGKIASATVKQGGNKDFGSVAGEADTINTQYGFKANVISSETPATADAPAVITYRGTPAATDGLTQDRLTAATKGENPAGLPLGWRYATATDTDGALIENKATGGSTTTDPGAFRVVLKPQNQKYDIATPTEKVTVADPANVTEAELAKIKEKVQLEYSKNNDDANLAGKKGTPADKTNKIQSVTKDDNGNLVVTYTDGSIDKKPLSEFVNVAPTVELPYSNEANKQIYVYTGENTDLTFKGTDEKEVKDLYLRGPGDVSWNNANKYGFTTGKVENGAVTGEGSVSEDKTSATIKMTGTTNLKAGQEWTSFIVSKDNNGELSNTDYRALDVDPNAKEKPGYVRFVVKNQTSKYDIATPAPADKVEVADPTKVTDAELDKIKEKLQIEYAQTNDDANFADKKGKTVDAEDAKTKIKSVEKDNAGNLVVTYTDGSTDKKPLSDFVVKDTTAPAKPVVNTDLTGKAGTKIPVEVTAEPGSTVELFDKDGNKIGEGVADENGKAKITPTVDIPEGNVTAKATKDGQTSDASAPKEATAATPAKPSTPVVDTDLTGKAGTKTPVEVTAEPGTKVELFDKDGNKIGEGVADENGKAKITPTVDIPEGNVTAKATKDGQTSDASAPKEATAATPAKPSTPVVDTDLTGKAGTKTPVEVTAEPGTKVELFDKDGNKIGEGVADENGKAKITPTVDIPEGNVTAKATKDGQTSDASAPKEATAATPAKPSTPVVDTDLTGKAGTKTPVEVTAEPGTKVELFDKDGNKIGEGVADENGKAKITPTVDIPEGNVTAKATKDGQTSDASAPKEATAATPAKPSTPVVDTDLTGKAGTKTPVEVTAEPGTKVELFDKDGNKIGEATAGTDGKATITPTVDIPAGNVTAKATKDGQTSDESAPKVATAATPAKPSTPVVDTDLTGKAGTKTPVEVTAEPGTKVELFDKDGNKIGEATAGTDGKATITPTVDIP